MGTPSFFDYMRAVPHSDKEKMDAVDLTLQGVVVCFLGLLFPPLLLIGLFPLFYGARKLVYVSMGLGLVARCRSAEPVNQPTSSKGSHADPAKPVPAITPEASAVRSGRPGDS